MTNQERSSPLYFALSLVLLLPAVWLLAITGFRGLYGQDAYAYYNYAIGPLRHSLLALQAPPPFYWPPGYPLLVALFSLPLGITPLAGQAASLLGAALVPIFTALLAREVWPEKQITPLLAGLFVALNGQLWQSAVVVMSDTVGLAAATLGVWALARYGHSGRARWLFLAAGALAYAVLNRWALALVAVVALCYALLLVRRRPRQQAAVHVLGAALITLLVLAPVLGGVVGLLTGRQTASPSFTVSLEASIWSPLNAFRRSFATGDGLLQYRLPSGLYYALAPARSFYLSPTIAAFLLPGLWEVVRRRSADSLLLLVGWAGVVYLFLAGIWQNFRFTLTYLPPLAILAAIGAVTVAGYLRRLQPSRWRLVMVGWLVLGVLWMTAGAYRLTSGFIATMQANIDIVHWATAQIPPDSHIIAFSLAQTMEHESELETHNLYVLDPAGMEALVNSGRPVYMLINVASVERQWAGRSPAENLQWLRDEAGLTTLGEIAGYTLYRVGDG